jgi:CheY-like chemotaxis protein
VFYNNVLLIDDDQDDVELFEEALQHVAPSVSFRCITDEKKELADFLMQSGAMPDLIFLDINLPSVNGWECLRRIRNEEPLCAVPVIMYTTTSQLSEKESAICSGAVGLITKPNDFRELERLLHSVLSTPVQQLPEVVRQFQGRV